MATDFQRNQVYAAEWSFMSWRKYLDDTVLASGHAFGKEPPPNTAKRIAAIRACDFKKFKSVGQAQSYLDRLLLRPEVVARFGPELSKPVKVRLNNNMRGARTFQHDRTIECDFESMDEYYMLHEVAHCLTDPVFPGHGAEFVEHLRWLIAFKFPTAVALFDDRLVKYNVKCGWNRDERAGAIRGRFRKLQKAEVYYDEFVRGSLILHNTKRISGVMSEWDREHVAIELNRSAARASNLPIVGQTARGTVVLVAYAEVAYLEG